MSHSSAVGLWGVGVLFAQGVWQVEMAESGWWRQRAGGAEAGIMT